MRTRSIAALDQRKERQFARRVDVGEVFLDVKTGAAGIEDADAIERRDAEFVFPVDVWPVVPTVTVKLALGVGLLSERTL